MAGATQHSTNKTKSHAEPPAPPTMADKAFQGVGDLINLLPTGTLFLFQFLNPLLTNAGHCSAVNRYLTGALLLACGFSCCFSSFTDSYIGSDGKVYYGVATKNGMWVFSDPNAGSMELANYMLRFGDFVHAFLSLVVFAVIALLDSNTVGCFYPSLEFDEQTLLMVLPTVGGGLASSVFMMFPNTRHGIGYPVTQVSKDSE